MTAPDIEPPVLDASAFHVLAPLPRFDHPNLRRRPTNILDAEADRRMDLDVRKECAGLRHDLRTTGPRLRRAFISGRFGRRERISLEWMVHGMRDWVLPGWHTLGRLTIYELARGLRVLGPEAGGFAAWLNQWADDPERPLPAPEWILYIDDPSRMPEAALDIPSSDPRRRDTAELGRSLIDLDGLGYSLPTQALEAARAARRPTPFASNPHPGIRD